MSRQDNDYYHQKVQKSIENTLVNSLQSNEDFFSNEMQFFMLGINNEALSATIHLSVSVLVDDRNGTTTILGSDFAFAESDYLVFKEDVNGEVKRYSEHSTGDDLDIFNKLFNKFVGEDGEEDFGDYLNLFEISNVELVMLDISRDNPANARYEVEEIAHFDDFLNGYNPFTGDMLLDS